MTNDQARVMRHRLPDVDVKVRRQIMPMTAGDMTAILERKICLYFSLSPTIHLKSEKEIIAMIKSS